MSKESYIKLYRKTLENPVVMKDVHHLGLWCWLLMSVMKFPKEAEFGGKIITLKPGQMTTGRKKIASALGEQESRVYRILKRFESEHLIEQRTDRQCTLITIVNWDKYQESEQQNEQEVNNERTTSEQRVNTKKERREREKERIDIYSDVPEAIKPNFMDWVQMRKDKKKPIKTKRAVTMALNKLNSLTKNTEKQKELIDYAIFRNWESFYPIPEGDKIPKPKKEEVEEEPIDAVEMTDEQRAKISETLSGLYL